MGCQPCNCISLDQQLDVEFLNWFSSQSEDEQKSVVSIIDNLIESDLFD